MIALVNKYWTPAVSGRKRVLIKSAPEKQIWKRNVNGKFQIELEQDGRWRMWWNKTQI